MPEAEATKYKIVYTNHTDVEVEAERIDYVDKAGGWLDLRDAYGTVLTVKAGDVQRIERIG